MRAHRALPYFAALLLLAWILGSLARSGTPGSNILSSSYWLLFIVYLLPVFALAAMVVMTAFLLRNWRMFSDALGFGIARRRRTRKPSSPIRTMVWLATWGIAIGVLLSRCPGIFCNAGNSTQALPGLVENIVGSGGGPTPPVLTALAGPLHGLAVVMGSPFFSLAFVGLLLVCTAIMVRSFMVSFAETKAEVNLPERVREEGAVAVQEALRALEMEETSDPRTRIIACYERMVRAAAGLGAHVSVDQTARELESGIRGMFQLRGPGIALLTRLFEEARYSLHTITEGDSEQAQRYLLEIGDELKSNAGN